jgi:hypothetical protein
MHSFKHGSKKKLFTEKMIKPIYAKYVSTLVVKDIIQWSTVFFIDGHVSHNTSAVSVLVKGTELTALFPNSRRLIQPIGMVVFHSLKVVRKQ